ncbi:response regulator receiver protein [Sphingobacterium deserti]|uniref:Response regulator receiver protein n=2 Tax=Sphingobacterium deserti TaxID=1229276 RepID=A0A0B8T698_9SPHI|nr:response regulator receiver protein [Sphingobacterium deserti]
MEKDVFICDDDKNIAEILGMIAEDVGASIAIETNSSLLFPRLKKCIPKLLIIDLWMPERSGEDIIRALRGEEVFQDLRILCISASIDGQQIARSAGADFYLAKPFDIYEVKALMNRVL